jgi:glucosylceramidase
MKIYLVSIGFICLLMSCTPNPDGQASWQGRKKAAALTVEVVETSAAGSKLQAVSPLAQAVDSAIVLMLHPEMRFQTITGIGGSFTEASAHLLNQLSPENRRDILEAYFGDEGARYSLTRTHINSCDFSLGNYSYAPIAGDQDLIHFTIDEDRPDLIPMIKEAQAISSEGFKIIASPWTAPPWMKDNGDWRGGKLLPEYYGTWAHFFSKYLDAYREEGIEIWGITVENEPLGNANNWESMHFSAEEMTAFVRDHLGPRLEADGQRVNILGYDQNRDELQHWVDLMYEDAEAARYFDGTAIHWYASTVEWFPDALQYAHHKAPGKYLIETEGCIDAEIPHWQDDAWYWSREATDWGWDWAPPETKHLHPKYVPVFRYARDIIGCLNNWVDGWVDWNMVLDRQGGPNWFGNWCVAPVIVDPEADEVYITPLYYAMAHFSKYIRPGAQRIGMTMNDESLLATAVINPDGSVVAVILNQQAEARPLRLDLNEQSVSVMISGQSIQTIRIPAS